jgi:hypothetical protein
MNSGSANIRLAMSKLIKIMAGLAFVSVGLAAPAQADANQDRDFYRSLTDPDQDHPMVIWNFPGIRSQGIASCQQEDAGATPMRALYYLDRRYGGPYDFDVANDITSAAGVIYCPWHLSPRQPVDVSAPVYPPPVYPPLMWSPSPVYPSNPPQLDYAR